MCWFPLVSSDTSITLEIPSTYSPSSIQDWQRKEEMPARSDRRYSSQPWILWQCIFTNRNSSAWPSLALLSTNLESTSECGVLGQYKVCSNKGTAVPPGEVKRDHSPRHSPTILWKQKKCFPIQCMKHHVKRQRPLWKGNGKKLGT